MPPISNWGIKSTEIYQIRLKLDVNVNPKKSRVLQIALVQDIFDRRLHHPYRLLEVRCRDPNAIRKFPGRVKPTDIGEFARHSCLPARLSTPNQAAN